MLSDQRFPSYERSKMRKRPKITVFDHFHLQNPTFSKPRVLKIYMHMHSDAFLMYVKHFENRSMSRYPNVAKTGLKWLKFTSSPKNVKIGWISFLSRTIKISL